MGITIAQASMFVEALNRGASFDRLLTIGRQTNYLARASKRAVSAFPTLSGLDPQVVNAPYAEPFFAAALGARQIDSLDISSYEEATILHDMNLPVPDTLHDRFDAVVDSGSLEHVFDFPTALANCMRMVRVSGSLFLSLPVNNFVGHGFYQFSPELFFRVFSAQNGFALQAALIVESWFLGMERGIRLPIYHAHEPATRAGRIHLINEYPTCVMVHAQRIGDVPVKLDVQQSDYRVLWDRPAQPHSHVTAPSLWRWFARCALSLMPNRWELWLRSKYERKRYYSINKRRHFVPKN